MFEENQIQVRKKGVLRNFLLCQKYFLLSIQLRIMAYKIINIFRCQILCCDWMRKSLNFHLMFISHFKISISIRIKNRFSLFFFRIEIPSSIKRKACTGRKRSLIHKERTLTNDSNVKTRASLKMFLLQTCFLPTTSFYIKNEL